MAAAAKAQEEIEKKESNEAGAAIQLQLKFGGGATQTDNAPAQPDER